MEMNYQTKHVLLLLFSFAMAYLVIAGGAGPSLYCHILLSSNNRLARKTTHFPAEGNFIIWEHQKVINQCRLFNFIKNER